VAEASKVGNEAKVSALVKGKFIPAEHQSARPSAALERPPRRRRSLRIGEARLHIRPGQVGVSRGHN
jgi:hypothetical protein